MKLPHHLQVTQSQNNCCIFEVRFAQFRRSASYILTSGREFVTGWIGRKDILTKINFATEGETLNWNSMFNLLLLVST